MSSFYLRMSGVVQSGALFIVLPACHHYCFWRRELFRFHLQDVKGSIQVSYVNLPTSFQVCDRPQKFTLSRRSLDHFIAVYFHSWGKLMQYGNQSQSFIRHVHKFICPNFDRIPKVSQFYITQVLGVSCLVSCLHNMITIQTA